MIHSNATHLYKYQYLSFNKRPTFFKGGNQKRALVPLCIDCHVRLIKMVLGLPWKTEMKGTYRTNILFSTGIAPPPRDTVEIGAQEPENKVQTQTGRLSDNVTDPKSNHRCDQSPSSSKAVTPCTPGSLSGRRYFMLRNCSWEMRGCELDLESEFL